MEPTMKELSDIDDLIAENNRLIMKNGFPRRHTKKDFELMGKQIKAIKDSNGKISLEELEKIK